MIRKSLARREALKVQRKLARDYAAGRSDARQILDDMEVAQLEDFDRALAEHVDLTVPPHRK